MPAAQPALAGGNATFNNMSNDLEFLVAKNLTQGGSYTDPVSSNAGDTLDVAVYYHNTAWHSDTDNVTAKNVRIKVTLPQTKSQTLVVKAELSADNAQTVTGTIYNGQEIGQPDLTINSSSAVTLEYIPGSVRWYPDRMDAAGAGANLPNGQSGDSIITTGISLGDIAACFDHAGFVKFKVKTKGEVIVPKAILQLSKEVRKTGDSQFQAENLVNPGTDLEYRITIKNQDGAGVAHNLYLKDTLPAGITYVGPTQLIRNGVTTTLADGITSANGIKVLDNLNPLESVQVIFKVSTNNSIQSGQCLTNSVGVTAENSQNQPSATAKTCFVVPTPTPTPTPPVTPSPTPNPIKPTPLPKTGPELPVAGAASLLVFGGTGLRYWNLKRQLKKQARSITVL